MGNEIADARGGKKRRGERMSSLKTRLLFLLLLVIVIVVDVSEGKKRGVSIPDDLDDVVDDEEDEAWREWGRKKKPNSDRHPPPDFSTMDPSAVQAEIMRRHVGPAFGFVKLRLGISRTKEEIATIAMRWTKVLRTGAVEVKFMAVDLSTIMFTMERGQDIEEMKGFILSQTEAYEMKIGDQTFRRPGDPPLEEVIDILQRKRNEDASEGSAAEIQHPKDEL